MYNVLSYCCEVAPSNVQFFKNRLLHSKNCVANFMKLLRPYLRPKAFSVAKNKFDK